MITAAPQLQFDLRLPTGRPLLPMEAVMAVLDRDEDDVTMLIEQGALGVAFDIAGKNSSRRDVRVWRESVLHYARKTGPAPDFGWSIRDILKPREQQYIRATEIKDRFTCSSTHVLQLLADGLIAGDPPRRRGPGSSPQILRNSVAAFLQSRRIL